MKAFCFTGFLIFTFCNMSGGMGFSDAAESDSTKKVKFEILQLQAYEDNLLGYTWDSDDKSFVDFTLSFRTGIFPFDYLMRLIPKNYRQDLHLHFAFTGRFGQYVGTRYSNAVLEKRFNPYLFFEYHPKKKFKNISVQAGYGHESNGQAIDDSSTFYISAGLPHNNINETIDKISRGWDYIGFVIKTAFFPKKHPVFIYETGISLKYFLDKGMFQGAKEEYHVWERDWIGANYTRNNVSGISVAFTCFIDSSFINKISISYETGIVRPLLASSVKLMLGIKVGNFPLSFTFRHGYNGDLAQFGKLTNSFGIESFIPSFQRPADRSKKLKGQE